MNRSTREEVLASDAVKNCDSRVALNPMTSYVRIAFGWLVIYQVIDSRGVMQCVYL
jgi:hypothetical protein